MKGIHLFPQKAKITGLWKLGGREGDQAEVLLPVSEDKAREQQTLSGFVLCEAQQLPAKRAFCGFGAVPWIFLGVNQPCEAQLSPRVPEARARPHPCWTPPLHRVLHCELNSISSATSRRILKWRYIPTPVEPVLLLSPSLSQNSLHVKHTNSTPLSCRFFLTDLHSGFTTCCWGVFSSLCWVSPGSGFISVFWLQICNWGSGKGFYIESV